MKKDKIIEEMDELIKQKAKKSGKSLGSYYRKILDYCKKRVGEK